MTQLDPDVVVEKLCIDQQKQALSHIDLYKKKS